MIKLDHGLVSHKDGGQFVATPAYRFVKVNGNFALIGIKRLGDLVSNPWVGFHPPQQLITGYNTWTSLSTGGVQLRQILQAGRSYTAHINISGGSFTFRDCNETGYSHLTLRANNGSVTWTANAGRLGLYLRADAAGDYTINSFELYCEGNLIYKLRPPTELDPDVFSYFRRLNQVNARNHQYDAANAWLITQLKIQGSSFWQNQLSLVSLVGRNYGTGALVPLRAGMAVATNAGFAVDDADIKTGWKGDATNDKLLRTGIPISQLNTASNSCGVWRSEAHSTGDNAYLIGTEGSAHLQWHLGHRYSRNFSSTLGSIAGHANSTGYMGMFRSANDSYVVRRNAVSNILPADSVAGADSKEIFVFARNGINNYPVADRLAFYHFGNYVVPVTMNTILSTYMGLIANV